jgi:diaminohydroxyphosphoribosylaminopyrimidine deaminase/5-amino-6-(5-phosphoribosylamino)uracil reductase
MKIDYEHMQHCIHLASKGMRKVAPNPMVGCVIVYQNEIIGKGYHQEYGKAHAEVNAINAVKDKSLLKESTLYVNLEPCAHFGKTPPCSDLIIQHQIPKVVIGCIDSFSEVSGKGIEKLKATGTEVIVGVLENESLALNKRFFTFHNKKRPYIILKWAETKDGFIDVEHHSDNEEVDNWITTPESKQIVHYWRSKEQAIMVGTNTALNDNPELTVREVEGENPLRIVLDLNLRLPQHIHLFDQAVPTIVFNYQKNEKLTNIEWIRLDKANDLITQILDELYNREIQSVIIEGGAQLLNTFIEQNLWDEARVFIGKKEFKKGLKAPIINQKPNFTEQIETDILNTYLND